VTFLLVFGDRLLVEHPCVADLAAAELCCEPSDLALR
jgi:hypothetical protein